MFLISHYSVLGAAYSMLITEFISLTALNYLFNQGLWRGYTLKHSILFVFKRKGALIVDGEGIG